MDKIKKKKRINALVLCLGELIIGILLLVKPVGFTSGIIIAIGVALMMRGVMDVVSYFKASPTEAAKQRGLAQGVICLLLGFVCSFMTKWLLAAFPFVGMIYGIMLVLLGIEKVQTAVDQKRLGAGKWYMPAISVFCGVIIMLNPFTTMVYMWMFTGISLIVEAIADIISFAMNQNNA